MKLTRVVMIFAAVIVLILGIGSCYVRPFMIEQSIVVQPHQTAFIVPKEASAANGMQLAEAQTDPTTNYKFVSATRLILPQRFSQTGRWAWQGKWIPMVDVVIVDRSPVALLWTADPQSGTSQADQAVWLESRDSIAFSIPFAISGYIKPQDAPTYLHFYSRNGLKYVLDNEGRNKVMELAAEYANKYPLNDLRAKKAEINARLESETEGIVAYFAKKGITITFVGIGGNSQYRSNEISASIDGVFIAQQLQNVELAKSKASKLHQQVTEKEGLAQAAKSREEANGPAQEAKLLAQAKGDVEKMTGEANAQAVTMLNAALSEAAGSSLFLKNRQLDVEALRVSLWDGEVPSIVSGWNDFVPQNVTKR